MLLSDLIPLSLFTTYAIITIHPHQTAPLLGPIISRLCSLTYHAFQPTYPALLYLDYIGICAMVFSVPAACSVAAEAWNCHICEPFNAGVALAALITIAVLATHAAGKINHFPPEHAVVALGLVGNLPVVAVVLNPSAPTTTRGLFAFSLLAFATGYFVLKPRHHVLWHWAAAAAQAAGVAGVQTGGRPM